MLDALLLHFTDNPMVSAKTLRDLGDRDEAALFMAALPFLRDPEPGPGALYLMVMLAGRKLLTRCLCDPTVFNREESIRLATTLSKSDPLIATKLFRIVFEENDGGVSRTVDGAGLRFLDLLATLHQGALILMLATPLMRHSDPRVRSKAALLVGRENRSASWAELIQKEPDNRVRANAVEALWGVQQDGVRQVFLAVAKDACTRVAANAMVGLYICRDILSISLLFEMGDSSDLGNRTSAAWAMGITGDPRFLAVLSGRVHEPGTVGRHALLAMGKIRRAKAKAQEGAPWRISIWSHTFDGSSARRIGFSVLDSNNKDVPGLDALNFIVLQAGAVVRNYKSRAVNPAGYELEYALGTDSAGPATAIQVFAASGWAEAALDATAAATAVTQESECVAHEPAGILKLA